MINNKYIWDFIHDTYQGNKMSFNRLEIIDGLLLIKIDNYYLVNYDSGEYILRFIIRNEFKPDFTTRYLLESVGFARRGYNIIEPTNLITDYDKTKFVIENLKDIIRDKKIDSIVNG